MGIHAGALRKTAYFADNSGDLDVDLTVTWNFSDLRGTLGADLDANGFTVTGLATPSASSDAATKGYVDNINTTLQAMIAGNNWKDNAQYATTANLSATYSNGSSGVGATLTGSSNGALSVDGSTPSSGERILVKNQSTSAQNGLYVVTTVGDGSNPFVLTRAADADSTSDITSMMVVIDGGSTNADTVWMLTTGSITLGTTGLSFSAWGGATYTDGAGLTLSGGQFSVNVDDSTIQVNGSDQLEVKDLGITVAKLSWAWASKEFTNVGASASHSAGVSTFTLDVAAYSTVMVKQGALVDISYNGVRLDKDGVPFKQVTNTPAAAGEFQLTGTSLKIYGNWTGVGATHLRVAYPYQNS